eukprot:RCo023350
MALSLLTVLCLLALSFLPSHGAESKPEENWVVSVHMGAHDNTLVISKGSEIQLVLELERIFGVRYFEKSHIRAEFIQQWQKAATLATAQVRGLNSPSSSKPSNATTTPIQFSVGIVVDPHSDYIRPWMIPTLKTVFSAKRWLTSGHQKSHALHAFYDSSFETALVISADTDENDGLFNVWWGERGSERGVMRLRSSKLNIALAYEFIGANMMEMNSGKREPRCWADHPLHCNKYAGTLMGYSSMGKPSEEWKARLKPLFLTKTTAEAKTVMAELAGSFPEDSESQRTIAASAQAVFEELLIAEIAKYESRLRRSSGLVIGGDIGLNVKANSAIQRHFDVPTWVPEAPSDDGVPMGAVWGQFPPKGHQELMYLGLPLSDAALLPELAAKYGAQRVTPEAVAAVLAGEKVIGMMQGRQEVGPRALMHRSLIAVPTSEAAKAKMNAIKARQWFRPVAPTMAVEAVTKFFGRPVNSPYMSFAPKLLPWVKAKYPAVYHYDGSARPQTVSKEQNPWAHALLLALGQKVGDPVVINTSFNTKGKPILNSVVEALQLMRDLKELDYVLVEDYLFSREAVLKVNPAAAQ